MNMIVKLVRSDGAKCEYEWDPLPRMGVVSNMMSYLNRFMAENPILQDDVEITATVEHNLSPQKPWAQIKVCGTRGWIWRVNN